MTFYDQYLVRHSAASSDMSKRSGVLGSLGLSSSVSTTHVNATVRSCRRRQGLDKQHLSGSRLR